MEKELAIANSKAEEVLVTVTERARESEAVKKSVMQKKEAAEAIVKAIQVDKVVAETALEAAKPALEEAEVSNSQMIDTEALIIIIIKITKINAQRPCVY